MAARYRGLDLKENVIESIWVHQCGISEAQVMLKNSFHKSTSRHSLNSDKHSDLKFAGAFYSVTLLLYIWMQNTAKSLPLPHTTSL